MRCEGAIRLINRDLCVLSTRMYNSKSRRNDIIAYWQKIYGPKFNELMLQIYPFVPLKFDKSDIANVPYYGNVRKAAALRKGKKNS